MEFTKEQIETARKILLDYCKQDKIMPMTAYLDSLLNPERKKIIVEIEYDANIRNLTSGIITDHFSDNLNVKVTELPEVFTREDITDLKNYFFSKTAYSKGFLSDIVNDWLSERKPK